MIDPLLGPLADNGGSTLTHVPLGTSPAVDAGILYVPDDFDENGVTDSNDYALWKSTYGIPQFDQRGDGALRVADGTDSGARRIDIGAVELNLVLTGDFDGDGTVGAADYSVWQDTRGSTTDLRADANGNGIVDEQDYEFWKQNFGAASAIDAAVGTAAVITSSALAQTTATADISTPLLAVTTTLAMAIIDEPAVALITAEEPESLAFAFALLGGQEGESGEDGVVLSGAEPTSEPDASLLLLAVQQSRSSAAVDPDPWSIDQEAEADQSTTALVAALAIEDLFGGIDI